MSIIYLYFLCVKKKLLFIFRILPFTWIYTMYTSGGDSMDYLEWFPKRVTELRMQKGVSARDMSLSLGQSESYINKIENRHTLPSMAGFLYICEYFALTPEEFFRESPLPAVTREFTAEFEKLPPDCAEHILLLIRDLNKH